LQRRLPEGTPALAGDQHEELPFPIAAESTLGRVLPVFVVAITGLIA
jgi:hypothetical protein